MVTVEAGAFVESHQVDALFKDELRDAVYIAVGVQNRAVALACHLIVCHAVVGNYLDYVGFVVVISRLF